jgi:hypothetical protein
VAFYWTWLGEGNAKLDGTNNVTEQVFGRCVKGHYRVLRGYKSKASIPNVGNLIGWARSHATDAIVSGLAARTPDSLAGTWQSIPKFRTVTSLRPSIPTPHKITAPVLYRGGGKGYRLTRSRD